MDLNLNKFVYDYASIYKNRFEKSKIRFQLRKNKPQCAK
jgi:hypothetical protein